MKTPINLQLLSSEPDTQPPTGQNKKMKLNTAGQGGRERETIQDARKILKGLRRCDKGVSADEMVFLATCNDRLAIDGRGRREGVDCGRSRNRP